MSGSNKIAFLPKQKPIDKSCMEACSSPLINRPLIGGVSFMMDGGTMLLLS